MPSALKKITTRAKAIFKKGGSWKGAIKKASSEYRQGKIAGARKSKTRKRKKAVGKVKHKRKRVGSASPHRDGIDRKRVDISIGSVAHHKSMAKKGLGHQLLSALKSREMATTKTARRKAQTRINKIKKEYRALC